MCNSRNLGRLAIAPRSHIRNKVQGSTRPHAAAAGPPASDAARAAVRVDENGRPMRRAPRTPAHLMLKRRLLAEPVTPAADWCRRSAAFALLLAAFAILLGRAGAVDGRAAVAVLGAALVFAVLSLLLAVVSAVAVWRTGHRGAGRALAGVVLASLMLAYPVYLAVRATQLPFLNDVTTDLANPPGFSASPAVRAARGGGAHADISPDKRDAQRRAYPDLAPVVLDLGAEDAFALVVKTVAGRRWRVLESVPPRGKFGIGRVDAVARSRVMGLPEDVTIRLRPLAGQTRVDLRAASRVEPHDLGSNAALIAAFAEDLRNAE